MVRFPWPLPWTASVLSPLRLWIVPMCSEQLREQIRQIRIRAGMLFQDFNLFPHMSVMANCIEAPTRVLGLSRDEAVARAERK